MTPKVRQCSMLQLLHYTCNFYVIKMLMHEIPHFKELLGPGRTTEIQSFPVIEEERESE